MAPGMILVPTSMLYKFISPTPVGKGVKLHEFKVTLRYTRPVVERRIVIAGDFTLQQLGRIAVCAIGFPPRHFDLWGPEDEYIQGYDPWSGSDSDSDTDSASKEPEKKKLKTILARNLIISELFNLREKKSVVLDYGHEGWLLDITLMKTRERDLKHYPKCISGKNACPPEDCGGPEGYKSLLKALKNPKHIEHQAMKEWLNFVGHKKFNPSKFTVSSVVFAN